MDNLYIVLVDEDESFLEPLQVKISQVFIKSTIEIITTKKYLEKYFSTPRAIDILIINKELYTKDIDRHNIKNKFVLVEDKVDIENEIFKYTSIKDICNYITQNLKGNYRDLYIDKKETQIIVIYSPIGGSGKTTFSVGMSSALSNSKDVMYISTEIIQSFKFLIDESETADLRLEKSMLKQDPNILYNLSDSILNKGFDYIKPFKSSTSSLGITLENFMHLICNIKELNMYDYIIVDTSSELNYEKCLLMSIANKVVVIVNQDKLSTNKIDDMLNNIDCSDYNKFEFVCTKFIQENENYIINDTIKDRYIVKHYINNIKEYDMDLEYIKSNKDFSEYIQKSFK